MVDDFEVEKVFEDRHYERNQFKLIIDGRKYKGDYHEGEIQWLHPHPKQDVGEEEVNAIEAKVLELLSEHGIRDEAEDIEIERSISRNQTRPLQVFKLKVQGEEFKGTFINGEIEWFHPKPRRKLKDERVQKIEEDVQKKLKEHLE
ncbi:MULTISPECIES: HicA family toxin-antitoxin system [unclassified Sporosarcina]|uniref:HicA family toxin-antitoxin system n=1 Tax=unclassified Sporosarcina TaxID=2647733 RepID=UPI001E5CA440|nr:MULTISPECIES: HicA family toxin-antitoxin system [unclassified Sporosarcina]